jgi:hypothetical protein
MRIPPAKGMQVTAHAIRNARINNPILIGGGRLKITIGTPPEQLLINGLHGNWEFGHSHIPVSGLLGTWQADVI